MGITKKPASITSDELRDELLNELLNPLELDEPPPEIPISDASDDSSDDSADEIDFFSEPLIVISSDSDQSESDYEPENVINNEPNNEPFSSPPSAQNNSILSSELKYSNESNNDFTNVDTKSLAFKKKHISQMGRRKANRAQNDYFLCSLSTDQQQHPEDEIFYNDNKNGFTKAINKLCSQPDLKESFIEGNDEAIFQENKRSATEMNNSKKSKRSIRPDVAFKNLNASQKRMFKQKSLPFTAISHLETELVLYFSRAPKGVYKSQRLHRYHRMLVHGIACYYSLDATSVNNSRGHRNNKIVKIRNNRFDDFVPPQMSLLKYVTEILPSSHK